MNLEFMKGRIYITALLILQFNLNAISQNLPGLEKFKLFAQTYFHAVESRDSIFLAKHTRFPILNSDFGLLISSEKKLPSINASCYYAHLKVFYPSALLKKIKKSGSCFKNIGGFNGYLYYFSLETPLKSDPDLTETYRWFFDVKGGEFVLTDFRYDCN